MRSVACLSHSQSNDDDDDNELPLSCSPTDLVLINFYTPITQGLIPAASQNTHFNRNKTAVIEKKCKMY